MASTQNVGFRPGGIRGAPRSRASGAGTTRAGPRRAMDSFIAPHPSPASALT